MNEFNLFIQLFETLKAQPILTLFLILGTGYLIGNVRIAGFSVGPVAGVLFAGLLLGHFGFLMSPITQALGIAAGVGLGMLSIRVGGISIRLGSAGGLILLF